MGAEKIPANIILTYFEKELKDDPEKFSPEVGIDTYAWIVNITGEVKKQHPEVFQELYRVFNMYSRANSFSSENSEMFIYPFAQVLENNRVNNIILFLLRDDKFNMHVVGYTQLLPNFADMNEKIIAKEFGFFPNHYNPFYEAITDVPINVCDITLEQLEKFYSDYGEVVSVDYRRKISDCN